MHQRLGAVVMAGALLLSGCSPPSGSTRPNPSGSPPVSASSATPASGTPSAAAEGSKSSSDAGRKSESAELPRGGRSVFPHYRLVGYSGVTGAKTLGRLGTGDLDQRLREMEHRAKPYARGRTILPVAEIIASIVQASPGKDNKYRVRLHDREIKGYLEAARRHDTLLLLNIQPGRSTFLAEVKSYERWLTQPDVGIALDPEWAMDPGQRPGHDYGNSSGHEIDEVSRYLSDLVQKHDLPEKVLVYHEVADYVVRKESGLQPHPGVAVVKSVDGIGSRGAKEGTYHSVLKGTPDFVHAGFKLFFTEDRQHGNLMTPHQVLALDPRPEYVLYE